MSNVLSKPIAGLAILACFSNAGCSAMIAPIAGTWSPVRDNQTVAIGGSADGLLRLRDDRFLVGGRGDLYLYPGGRWLAAGMGGLNLLRSTEIDGPLGIEALGLVGVGGGYLGDQPLRSHFYGGGRISWVIRCGSQRELWAHDQLVWPTPSIVINTGAGVLGAHYLKGTKDFDWDLELELSIGFRFQLMSSTVRL